jgi:hypothetical protein
VPDNSTYVSTAGRDRQFNYTLKELTPHSIRRFVALHSLPTLIELDNSNFQSIRMQTQDKVLLMLAYDRSPESQPALKAFTKVATRLRKEGVDSVQACLLDFEANGKLVEIYKLERAPALLKVIIQGENKLFAIKTEGLDEEGIMELYDRQEVQVISEAMWTTVRKLIGRMLTLEVFSDNLLVFGIVAAILGVSLGIAYLDTPEKEKED